jgi:meso-butanediol dehydrogenase / (S,S)-butanediol dehydrogenase / diacetyl reductase
LTRPLLLVREVTETRPLHGKVALVTGAGRGIGYAVARRLAQSGASVAVADIDVASAAEAAHAIEESGGLALPLRVDTSSRAEVQVMVHGVAERFGRLDVAFNNAGVGHNAPFLDITDAEWDLMFRVNARGVFLCIQEEARQMISQGTGGKIINTASVAGRHGSAYQAHYSASKFAVIGLTQSAAKALAEYKITVNAMNPGIIDTTMWRTTDQEMAGIRFEERGQALSPGEFTHEVQTAIPLARIGSPDDVAGLAVFLASRESDYITGQAINVCGGLIMD